MPKLPIKTFSSHPGPLIPYPNFVEIQTQSYRWFLEVGLKELLAEISPIKDFSGKDLELHFLDYYFDEPKYDEAYSRLKDLTYESPLRVKLRLVNNRLKDVK